MNAVVVPVSPTVLSIYDVPAVAPEATVQLNIIPLVVYESVCAEIVASTIVEVPL